MLVYKKEWAIDRLIVNLGGTAEAGKLLSLIRDESFF
jgi:hypothetical protein